MASVIRAHTVAQVRAAEAALAATLPPGALMSRAATGLAHACARELGRTYGARVLLLVGGGDNGADALYAGAQLCRRGAQVRAATARPPRPDALAAFLRAGGRLAGPEGGADLVVDGLVGIGGSGPLRGPAAELLSAACRAGAGGRPAERRRRGHRTGVGAGGDRPHDRHLRHATSRGCWSARAATRAGRVQLVDLGLGPYLPDPPVEAAEAADLALPPPAPRDKYDRGVVGIAAGSPVYPGAAVLAVGAALAAGAGMVRFVGAAHPAEQVRLRWPESVVTEAVGADVLAAGRVQAWVVGPGLGTDDVAAETVQAVLATDLPVLVDADALTVCAGHPGWLRRDAPTLLTPHDGEYARFGAPVGPDRLGAARRLAATLGVHVLLKGAATVIAGPDGAARVNRTGTPALAAAGSGDVLAGACGALLAQGLGLREAATTAAFLHGRAGALASDGLSSHAGRLLSAWPEAVRALLAERMPA